MNKDQVINLIQTVGKIGGGIVATRGAETSSLWESAIGFIIAAVSFWYSHKANATPTTPAPTGKLPLALLFAGLICVQGCATADTNAYKTLAITATTVDSSRQAWNDYVSQGKATVAEVQTVADAYAKYQGAMAFAQKTVIAYEANKASGQLQGAIDAAVAAAMNFTSLIATFKK